MSFPFRTAAGGPPDTLDLLAIGDPCADLVYRTDRLPTWDDKTRGTMLGLFGGGTEANAACTAARLGWRCALFGHTGDDLHADFIRDELALHGVRLDHLKRRAGGSSSVAVVAVSPEGERSVVWLPPGDRAVAASFGRHAAAGVRGAELATELAAELATQRAAQALDPDRGPERRAALARSRWAYTMPYDPAALALLARETTAAGTGLAIDVEREGAAAAPGGLPGLLQLADVAFLNRGGFEAATGQVASLDTLQALCRGGRARTVVVTLGAAGALAADRDDGTAQAAAGAPAVVDTTGAGDTFNATFLVARGRGAPLQLALEQACRAAARTVAAFGARGALAGLSPADAGPHEAGTARE